MLKFRRALGLVLAIVLTIQPIAAWSECGHHIIAILAFDQLNPKQRQHLLSLLANHPRYEDDFRLHVPRSISQVTEIGHWFIGRAGYWPDVARNQPEFNRPTWHYQLGSSLTIGEAVKVPETPGALPPDADLKTQELYIVQAIQLCRQTVRNEAAPDSDKAIAICWLAHLVADAHQPCHAGSLYAGGIFPEGDRGANSIPTKQSKNLHALWDGLLGGRYDAGDIDRRVGEIRRNVRRTEESEAAVKSLEPLLWLAESAEFGRSHVYSPDVLDAVEAARRAGAEKVETVDLPETYLQAAGALAQGRAAFAGHRLAAILSEDLTAP